MASSRDAVYSAKAPKPPSFLSQAVRDGGRVYCSGQVGMDPQTGKMIEGTVQDRTVSKGFRRMSSMLTASNQRQILQNLASVLEAGGSDMSRVIKVNIFLTDMGDFAAMNEVYDTFFTEPKPVSSVTFGVDQWELTYLPGSYLRCSQVAAFGNRCRD